MTTKINVLPTDQGIHFDHYSEKIKIWDDVALLGSKNIAALLIVLRRQEKALSDSIAKLYEDRKLFDGKDGGYFKQRAKDFENPKSIKVKFVSNGTGQANVPVDEASREREEGVTTFNVCGWCKYAGDVMQGGGAGNTNLRSSCRLLTKEERFSSPRNSFDTPCLLHDKSAEYFAERVANIDQQIKEILEGRENVRAGIKILLDLKKNNLPQKPILPMLRNYDYYKNGDELVINFADMLAHEPEIKLLVTEEQWVKATALPYKSTPPGTYGDDGSVYYRTAVAWIPPIEENPRQDGFWGGVDQTYPSSYLLSEFEYLRQSFKNDQEFMESWLDSLRKKVADRFRTVNLEKLVHNLEHGVLLAA